MKYEDTPRPLVEEHYHIRELIEKQEKRTEDRVYHRDKAKNAEDREDHIRTTQILTVTDFYCPSCNKDFKSQAIKQVEVDWSNIKQNIGFYKTKCFCGTWCMRLISDRHRDRYWFKSINVARDRGKHYGDTLQPFETGFNLLYGKRN